VEEEHYVEETACISFVHQNVIVEALVKIKPRVRLGEDFEVECGEYDICKVDDGRYKQNKRDLNYYREQLEELLEGKDPHHGKDDECSYIVRQELCLRIPLIFSAEAFIKNEKAVCIEPYVEHDDDEEDYE